MYRDDVAISTFSPAVFSRNLLPSAIRHLHVRQPYFIIVTNQRPSLAEKQQRGGQNTPVG